MRLTLAGLVPVVDLRLQRVAMRQQFTVARCEFIDDGLE